MKKKMVSPLLLCPLTSAYAESREDIQLMKKLTKKYTGGNTFERPEQIQAMANDFGVDVMEALNWTMGPGLPVKYFDRAKELLK